VEPLSRVRDCARGLRACGQSPRTYCTFRGEAAVLLGFRPMADIVSDIVFSATNPLEDDDAVDTEDTDACVVPDFFDDARRFFTTGAPDFHPRRIVRAAQCGAVIIFCLEVLGGAHLLFSGDDLSTVLNDGVHPFGNDSDPPFP
jgi:hypothetical protein